MKNIVNVYEAVDSNRRKSILVVVFFVVFITLVSWVFAQALDAGIGFVGFALIFSGLASMGGYWWSDKVVLSLSGARPADRHRDFHFYTVTENLAMAAGIPMPRLYVIQDPAPNAFATGRDPNHAAVVATSGLLASLDRTELEGVIAHELSHVQNYDIRLAAIVAVLVGMVVLLADWFLRLSYYGRGDRQRGTALFIVLGLALALLSPLIAQIIQLTISRRREFFADAQGVKLTRYPAGLARALEKISRDREPLEAANKATAHLYIVNPLRNHHDAIGWFANLFNTHPPVEERIAALRAMV